MISEHVCRASEDPRHSSRCACGQPLVKVRPRNLDFEQQVIEHVSHGVCDPEPLIRFARTRCTAAGYGLQSVRVGPKWLHEMREELADAANYATWWLETHLDHEDRYQVERALQSVVLAFDCTNRVEAE